MYTTFFFNLFRKKHFISQTFFSSQHYLRLGCLVVSEVVAGALGGEALQSHAPDPGRGEQRLQANGGAAGARCEDGLGGGM